MYHIAYMCLNGLISQVDRNYLPIVERSRLLENNFPMPTSKILNYKKKSG